MVVGDLTRCGGSSSSRALLWVAGLAAFAAAAWAGGATAVAGSGRAVFMAADGPAAREMSRVDPLTLGPVSAPVETHPPAGDYATAPDGSRLAWVFWSDETAHLGLLDLRRLSAERIVGLGRLGAATAVAWFSNQRILVLAEQPDGLRALLIDARGPRLLRVDQIPAHFAEFPNATPTRAGVVVLVRPSSGRAGVHRASVAIVSASGASRVVAVPKLKTGAIKRNAFWEIHRPALAADARGTTAYLVGAAAEPIAAVDLRTLAVSYHRARGLPRPTAAARTDDRRAFWIRPGVFATLGYDVYPSKALRVGLTLVDTRTWRAKTVDRRADFATAADGLIISQRNRLIESPPAPGVTVAGYALGGSPRFKLIIPDASAPVETVSNGRYLYLILRDAFNTVVVVDERSGRVVGRVAAPPQLAVLLAPGGL